MHDSVVWVRRPGPHGHPPEYWLEFAERYVSGGPAGVRDWLGCTMREGQNAIAYARAHGWLPPTRQGTCGLLPVKVRRLADKIDIDADVLWSAISEVITDLDMKEFRVFHRDGRTRD